ncbi:MAG TPA: SGNH/GDSL hydrolase family protein [Pirellula sp.]|nr:SGNH/GDSL hydrolase family protein [Pirellula sp.]
MFRTLDSTATEMDLVRSPARLGLFARRIGLVLRLVIGSACATLLLFLAAHLTTVGEESQSRFEIALAAALFVGLMLMLVPGKNASRFRSQLTALGIGCLLAFGMLEVYVRQFDPFPILLRAGRIDLPANTEREFSSDNIPGLDPVIKVSYNSLGFRGPERPQPWAEYLTILCVGGSTTQCLYLSDGTSWPDRLGANLVEHFDRVWVNNAGIDGHSTFGHLELFEQYIAALHPKVILAYVALNDVDRNDLNQYDESTFRNRSRADDSNSRWIQRVLLRNSDAFALMDNLRLHLLAMRKGLTHGQFTSHQHFASQFQKLSLTSEARHSWLAQRSPDCLSGYRKRLERLLKRCADEQILCVLITQPTLYGEGIDDVTGMDLESVKVGDVDGWTQWQLLKQYNQVTLEVASQMNVPAIDVARQMPKSSKYFYDLTHCNIDGAAKVSELVQYDLVGILKQRFPTYFR